MQHRSSFHIPTPSTPANINEARKSSIHGKTNGNSTPRTSFMNPSQASIPNTSNQQNGQSNFNDLLKFTSRSYQPELINKNSLAIQVMKLGKIARLNNLSRVSSYNPLIDSVPGIDVKRILSIPLIATSSNGTGYEHEVDTDDKEVYGTIHFINKSTIFTEIDEIILKSLVSIISNSILTCHIMHESYRKSNLLELLLESSSNIYNIFPDPLYITNFTPKHLLQPQEILETIESICYNVLKVAKSRCFLISDNIQGYLSNQVIFLDPNNHNGSSNSSSP
jgi:hypothetical protein